jgi:hypothetical protein
MEMPKWIMRLVPDVPLGAESWVTAASRWAGNKDVSRVAPAMRLIKL